MEDSKCIIQNVHIDTTVECTESAEMRQVQLELLLAKLICKELNNEFAEYLVN